MEVTRKTSSLFNLLVSLDITFEKMRTVIAALLVASASAVRLQMKAGEQAEEFTFRILYDS